MLQKIRAGENHSSITSHFKEEKKVVEEAILPETRFCYEFPYGSDMPPELTVDNPYLKSLIYEASKLYTTGGPPWRILNHKIANLSQPQLMSLYLKPFHAAVVIDPLISDLKPSEWTTVCSNDVLMRKLLSVWFRCEYQLTAAFNKNLFLKDMAAKRRKFCSPLLVNAVLAYACVRPPPKDK